MEQKGKKIYAAEIFKWTEVSLGRLQAKNDYAPFSISSLTRHISMQRNIVYNTEMVIHES